MFIASVAGVTKRSAGFIDLSLFALDNKKRELQK